MEGRQHSYLSRHYYLAQSSHDGCADTIIYGFPTGRVFRIQAIFGKKERKKEN